jgi:group I intron endonuclease
MQEYIMIGYIYKTTNTINNKCYIGKKYGVFDSNYFGSGKILNQAIKKYGISNFICEALCECNTEEELNNQEIYFISQNSPKYNLAAGGTGGDTLKYANSEYKQMIIEKRKESLKKKWNSINDEKRKEWGDSISKSKKGKASNRPGYKHHSESVKKRIAESNRIAALSKSEEIKENQRKAMEQRKGMPNVACHKKVEYESVVYHSVKEACAKLGICSTTLKKRIKNGKGKYLQ